MKLSDSDLLELSALCDQLIDGVIEEPGKVRLESMLSESASARRFYVRMLGQSASLFDYAGEMQADAPEARGVKRRRSDLKRWGGVLAGLAAAAGVALLFWWSQSVIREVPSGQKSAELEGGDEGVGRISGLGDCQWAGGGRELGSELRQGERIELKKGTAEITFDCGAVVTIEGPTVMEMSSAWEAVVVRGTLRAVVPREAVGFRVGNASVEVVDLGTEFSLVAEVDGGAEVFVHQGSVEATPKDGAGNDLSSIILKEHEGRRFEARGILEVTDTAAKLARLKQSPTLERVSRPTHWVRWSFDEPGGVAFAETGKQGSEMFSAQIEPPGEALSAGTRTEGRWNRALLLDGKTFAQAPFPRVTKFTQRTVAFWIQIPVETSTANGGTILAWPLGGNGRGIEVGWNRDPLEGTVGALKTGNGRHSLIGNTPIRDGQWHHLAVVFSVKQKATGNLQMRQYVDGRLDGVSLRRNFKRARGENLGLQAKVGGGDEMLWIGANIPSQRKGESFRGAIDELLMVDRVLTPEEIRQLITSNHIGAIDGKTP